MTVARRAAFYGAAAEEEAAAAARTEAEREADQRINAEQAAAERGARRVERFRKVNEFLKMHGFKGDVNSKKSYSMFKKYKYPLHVAVKEQDVEMVQLLLLEGADQSMKNSSGYTPAEKAEQYRKQNRKPYMNVSTEVLLALTCLAVEAEQRQSKRQRQSNCPAE